MNRIWGLIDFKMEGKTLHIMENLAIWWQQEQMQMWKSDWETLQHRFLPKTCVWRKLVPKWHKKISSASKSWEEKTSVQTFWQDCWKKPIFVKTVTNDGYWAFHYNHMQNTKISNGTVKSLWYKKTVNIKTKGRKSRLPFLY